MSGSAHNNIYTPLDRSRREIRLIEIISIKPTIICNLSTVSLDENPTFSALSYLWGDTGNTEHITVNGVTQAVTPSLANALDYIPYHWEKAFAKRHSKSLRLWADALCINQDDNQEKGHQVQLMKAIYPAAELVFSCLDIGAQESDVRSAFHSFESITKGAIEHGFINREDEFAFDPENHRQLDLEWILGHPLMIQDQPWGSQKFLAALEAMAKVMALRYWERAWIFQEIALARRLIIIHKFALLDLEILLHAMHWVDAVSEKASSLKNFQLFVWQQSWRIFESLQLIDWARKFGSRSEHLTDAIHEQVRSILLVLGGNYGVKNPKDHVYAMLGVSGLDIKPDYTSNKSLASVYIDVCAELMEKGQPDLATRLCFLVGAGLALRDKGPQYELPSWVYNFPQVFRGVPEPPLLFRDYEAESDIEPWGWYKSGEDAAIYGHSLFAPAGFITTVVEATPTLDSSLTAWPRFLSSVFRMVCRPTRSTEGHHPLLSLARALGADNLDMNVWEAPQAIRLIRVFQFLLFCNQVPVDKVLEAQALKMTEEATAAAEGIIGKLAEDSSIQDGERSQQHLDKQEDRRKDNEEFISRIRDKEAFQADMTNGQIQQDVMVLLKSEPKVCLTESGEFVVLPRIAEKGDSVVLLKGHCRLSLVRKVHDHFVYIGDCWFSRMPKEFAEKTRSGELEMEMIEIR
ncbi:hypothetical protein FSARC_10241 [Fusarium sarcochroum]|uniref:Heterokaryon incompatibility domain-containing protein n=1 Tax=Fusarium sarcochroum TaxID=1208366 RepID=A0A8H4TNY0_9HYPO|nr:hypothetical protein FSARC_10241 [Fusarium sarcochroum]